ncbi:tRNA (adenosine(37)-N6)-threonylcarbamoyltransferase complex transferase subunit TsaD [Candidatus Parcubacteria bacterium]|nr:tRNA (adenosine(37)-N6)-threonylcarbamoyltransferase complex transferase subunit TsaD [Candidatus Parcubacteria bacterium]
MKILGIESSADETAAAVVEFAGQRRLRLLSNSVASSLDLQKVYGGIVPEIAARSHLESIIPVIDQALSQAFARPGLANRNLWSSIDAIAVTRGPGLGGSLLIGVLTARTLAILKNKPLYAVNHVEAHVYANFITSSSSSLSTIYQLPTTAPRFPILALIVSGGHTQLVLFEDHFKYQVLGRTQDDAVGEAFDKVAKILGLPYPGGPSVEIAGQNGDPTKVKLPKAKMPGKYDFSYSGLKTAVLRAGQSAIGEEDYSFPSYRLASRLSEAQKADIAASFSYVAIEALVDKTIQAYDEFAPKSVVIAGGVAASKELRRQLSERLPTKIEYTDIKLCTDNAAMIAAHAYYQAKSGKKPVDPKALEISPGLQM